VLPPGGRLLLAFQAGESRVHLDHPYGHEVSLVVHHRSVEAVTELLTDAGLVVHARLLRDPERWEQTPQAYLIARRTAGKP
jgi:hypothetical protein